ncbi:Spo0E family sporulation regulatory protein-aspartic acid phosphatase [Cytobacillus gottheilii]|uniref:Aspartyl-phosphate phosphatase Spo0E family protein n=1 Tax=Cytobacillus gottheilii TaxID=859144 RepID=A0ABX8FBK1_9BACI|nr:aspartyl-phosphate phosphatase Spo0E family protein [Cytobacillus gottheilii]QVY61761.1 aspartyl-phosphate phosphatase Spo0E family protein [Cytobacillus gottheilii]
MCVDALLNDIEFHRREMVHLAATTSLSSEEVIRTSVKLDQLLNEYNMIQSKNK